MPTDQELVLSLATATQAVTDRLGSVAGELASTYATISTLQLVNGTLSQSNSALNTEVARLKARIAELEAGVPPSVAKVLMGMATEDGLWAERVSLTGPVACRRVFEPRWDIQGLVSRIEEVHSQGLVPIASIKSKMTATDTPSANWAAQASGAWDSRFVELARALDALGYPVWFNQDHEPRGGGISTVEQLKPWGDARARQFEIMRSEMGDSSLVKVGPCDNGHPWGAKWGSLADAQLSAYYTQRFLRASQYLSADFYNGATNANVGEPASVKMENFVKWTDRVGFDGPLGVGEWNFVTGSECRATWPVLNTDRWGFACLFNSDQNNRTDLPTSIGGSWSLKPGTDRLAAFREILDLAEIPGR